MNDFEGALSLKEAAEYLGYEGVAALREIVERSRAKVRGAAVKGSTIRFSQHSKKARIVFKREWLDEFIAEHTVDPTRAVEVPTRRAAKRAAQLAAQEHWSFCAN